ncbi:MAG: EamA family transporter [Roseovarius sp.]|uniref:EamA family transporter n=1 Tax=Roseovarius sp. TaxID=1486281 RepID=UPI0032EECF36
MTGEALALGAALAYGLAGVLIVRGKAAAQGDNGAFLSVVMTAGVSGLLWLGWGSVALADMAAPGGLWALAIFALAGVMANVFGRQSMYRATGLIGAVRAGLLRRLTPLFALPCAFVILGEVPDLPTIVGGAVVLGGVVIYMRVPAGTAPSAPGARIGLALGVLSALAYALAYTFRGLGLEAIPDAALGTCIGALVGAGWIFARAVAGRGMRRGWRFLTADRGSRHLQAALALTAGQVLQFHALKYTTILSVAVLGTLEVLFSALFVWLITRSEPVAITRLIVASAMAMAGTALLFL